MTDVHTPEQRSRNMAAIRSKNTKPEMVVRRLLCEMGLRYRLHRTDLPGKPDIVMPGRKTVIFVHGCFFHMHKCRYGQVLPSTNAEFWAEKRKGNVQRDRRNARALRNVDWRVISIWECETRNEKKLRHKLNYVLPTTISFQKQPRKGLQRASRVRGDMGALPLPSDLS